MQYHMNEIGKVSAGDGGFFLELAPEYIPALRGLEGFSHLNVIWWCDGFDRPEARQTLTTPRPYRNAPEELGIFATRAPLRPNPVALTAAQVLDIDYDTGRVQIAFIDANDGSPVLDLKPYTPSLDRVERPAVPEWCEHWPKSLEASASFPWEGEFNF